jgi:NADH:ubiquinone oxidoreductase subunit 5 (subunit L)/multisubunit Na+/H+ antiporter MnhA subunit
MSEWGLGLPLAIVAAATILIASVIALRQDNLKRRLAYSTISQLSYIILGLALLSPSGLVGGLLHIPAHAFMKLTLFFAAGAIHVETHIDDISDMVGIGRRMPVTMAAFGIASVGMAGLPLVAGFVSKWYLLIGSLTAGQTVFVLVLLASGLLNVAYFWPIVYQAFFQTPADVDAKPVIENPFGGRPTRADGGQPDGEYAVDRNPSDVDWEATEEPTDDDDAPAADDHHGPPAGGWEWHPFGTESTWFMLGPILVTATGAIVLGIDPQGAIFLELIFDVVESVSGVTLG